MRLAWHTNVEYDRAGPGLLNLLNPATTKERGNLRQYLCHIRYRQHEESIPSSACRLTAPRFCLVRTIWSHAVCSSSVRTVRSAIKTRKSGSKVSGIITNRSAILSTSPGGVEARRSGWAAPTLQRGIAV